MKSSILGYAGILAGFFGALGCAVGVDEEGSEAGAEDVSTSREAVTTSTVTDPTGTFTISYTQCDATNGGGARWRSCAVPSDYALIGGGAEILGSPAPGALLTGSHPDQANQRWIARAKDHNQEQFYDLRAYAIGLKIANVSATSLRSQISFVKRTKTISTGILSDAVSVPSGTIVLGGGVNNYVTAGTNLRLLTVTAPVCNNDPNDSCSSGTITGWFGQSKDHFTAAAGSMDTYLIAMPQCIQAGTALKCFKNSLQHAQTGTSGGYQTVLVDFSGPVAGIGARAEFAAPGRLLTDIFPIRRSSTVVRAVAESKDHQKPANGSTHVYSIGLAMR